MRIQLSPSYEEVRVAAPDTIANAATDGSQVDRRMLIGGRLAESCRAVHGQAGCGNTSRGRVLPGRARGGKIGA